MRLIAAAILLVASAASAQDVQWLKINEFDTGSVLINPDSIKLVSGSTRRAWLKIQNKTPNPKTKTDHMVQMLRINCTDETTATVSTTSYGKNNQVLKTQTIIPELLDWEPAAPGTMAAGLVDVVCKFKLS
jgi:hypothetical protein